MNEESNRFNPEPWLRSVLWVAVAIAVMWTIFRGSPLKLSGGGVDVEFGNEAVSSGDSATAPTVGGPTIQRDTAGATFISVCPKGTRAVGGSCWIKPHTAAAALQNFGSVQNKEGSWQFVCAWVEPVQGDAQAICLPSN